MAEIDNYLAGPVAPEENKALGTAGDFAKTLGVGAASVGAGLAADARYFFEQGQSPNAVGISKKLQELFNLTGDTIEETINPETQKLINSQLTSEEFLSHPILGTALKVTKQLPNMAALAIPAGLMANTVRGAMVLSAGGAAINAGAGIDEFYQKLDKMSDEELQKESPKYAAMREMMDEGPARERFNKMSQGWAPMLNALIGAASANLGPAAIAARGMTGGVKNAVIGAGERGRLGSAGIAAGQGVASEAVEEGSQDFLQQGVEMEAQLQKEFDVARTANAALEGGFLGGVMGGAVGGIAGGKRTPRAAKAVEDAIASTNTPDAQVQNGTTGQPGKPAEIVANPQNAPTTTPSDKGKATPKTAAPKTPAAPAAVPVDPAVAAAVGANEGKPVNASATEVAAMTQRSPNETLDKLDQEGAPPAVPPEVTPPAVLDTGANVPESAESIIEQFKQIGTGGRKAVMIPRGGPVPKKNPPGLNRVVTDRGVFFFDKKLTTAAEIKELSKAGRENELLGLGPVSKPDAVADAAAGATPVAVTERTPEGTEVKAAAGTTATLPEQVASLEVQKTPGNVVAVEAPAEVVEKRNERGGRILNTNTENVVNPKFEDNEARAAAADEERLARIRKAEAEEAGKGAPSKTNYRGERGRKRDAAIATAKEAVAAHPPNVEKEKGAQSLPGPRAAVVDRARAMVSYAEKKLGKAIQSQIKLSKDGTAPSDSPDVLMLRIAKDLVRNADNKSPSLNKIITDFQADEFLIANGFKDEVIKRRLEEGNRAKQQGGGDENASRLKADESDLDEQGNVVAKGLDEENFEGDENSPEKSDDEMPSLATGEVSSVDADAAITPEGDLTEYEAGEIKQGPSVAHIKEVVNEKAKAPVMSAREKRKAMLRPPTKNAIARAAASGVPEATLAKLTAEVSVPKGAEALRRQRPDPNPTPAQIEAENYRKGHRLVDGLDFTIENRKGMVRRSKPNAAVQWQVKMPADYGYIRGTKGADGDHIDAYDGRNGDRYFVIDQLDNRTGEFDEHKVMMRFKDEASALAAYRSAFSDGQADQRLGNVHELTLPELKQWLKNEDTTQPATATLLDPPNLRTMSDEDLFDAVESQLQSSWKTYDRPKSGERTSTDTLIAEDGTRIKTIRSDWLVNELERFDFKNMTGVGGKLSQFFHSRFMKLAQDVDAVVHYITEADMARLTDTDKKTMPLGLHWIDDKTGQSNIAIVTSLQDSAVDHQSLAHIVLHETAHAFTVRELRSDPAARAVVRRLMNTAEAFMARPDMRKHLDTLYGEYTLKYGFTNEAEFVAEAFSNENFQEVLAMIRLDDPMLSNYLGLDSKKKTLWDAFRYTVKRLMVQKLGPMPKFDSVLDAIMKVGEKFERDHRANFIEKRGYRGGGASDVVQTEAYRMVDDATRAVREMLSRPENNTAERTAKLLGLRTFDNIAQLADSFFGESNPVRKIHAAVEKMRITGQRIFERSEPVVRMVAELRAKNATAFHEWSSLLTDATVANVHPDVSLSDPKNAHLGKKRVVGNAVWSKAQHAELQKRFNALPEEFKAAWHKVTKHYADMQNQKSLGIINNQILKLLGINDAALAGRIHDGTLTDADRNQLGGNLEVIEKASELSKIEGPYVPLIRRGDHVILASYKVTLPGNAKKLADNEFEFVTEKEATDYAKTSKLQTTIRKVWVDEKTGLTTQVDPATGKEHTMLAEDLDSVARYRVDIQNRVVEFVQGRRAAEALAAEMRKDASLEVSPPVPRAYEPDGRQSVELSTALSSLTKKLEKSDAYKEASPTQRAALKAAMNEAALASHGSTRVSSKSLVRRNVKGYSEDMVAGLVDYGASSSRYLAKLEHSPELEAALTDMKAQLDRDHSKTGTYARTAISNEVRKRVEGDNGFEQGGLLAPITKRLLSLSFIDKLGSPAYSVINAMQTGMITMPYLSAKFGVGRTFAAMGKAYADLNAGAAVKAGIRETGKKLLAKEGQADFLANMTRTLSTNEKAMIDAHLELGTIDASAGMEIADLARDYTGIGGKADAVLGYLEGVTRQMPRAIETINRTVTALATYRLEVSRGVSHEAAVQASQDAVNNTQFNYAATNSPALFNHPLLKLALQFKKYGQGMYQLIGTQIGNAMRNENPGDRARAVKTLIGIAATHTAMAGALGLPTEPFKYLLMPLHGLGFTKTSWGDVEDQIRRGAAEVFGTTGGEILTRGLPRAIGLDLSRMGLDSVTSFGEPRGKKDADVKSWLFDSVAGPVVSLGGDYLKGISNAANGDFVKAAEQLIPLKVAADTIRAYRQATEGKKSATTGRQTMTPYTPKETVLRALGFGGAREAETNAAAGAYYRQSAAQKETRNELVKSWVEAKPAEKAKAWSAIVKWNQSQPGDVKISPSELTSKAKRDAKAAQAAVRGINPNKRDKRFLDEGFIYNVR